MLVGLAACPADGGNGNRNPPDTIPPDTTPPPPNAPTNLTAAAGNTRVILSWRGVTGAAEYYLYRATAGGATDRIGENTTITTITTTTYTDSGLTNDTAYTYTVSAVNANGESDASTAETATPRDIDRDGDLLIDISFLEELNNIRYNLAGTAYKTSDSDPGAQCGAMGTTDCAGYELLRSLDFASAGSYAGAINDDWRPDTGDPATATNAGWNPIGGSTARLIATFDGNGNTISNLYIRRSGRLGLFSGFSNNVVIRNIGIINGMIYGGSGDDSIGELAGSSGPGTIVASYASGGMINGGGGADSVGGLVGFNNAVIIVASYATVDVDGGDGEDFVGGARGIPGWRRWR